MSPYLTSSELSELTGYQPNQFEAFARWLERNGWVFARDRNGLPRVARAYHDAKMFGVGSSAAGKRPKFEALSGG